MTLEELKNKVNSMFLSYQQKEYGWDDLEDTDKEAALNNANFEFNRLQYIGHKVDESQADAFPRLIYNETVETPDAIKCAIAIYCMNWIRYMTDETIQDIKKGVTGVHIGNYSESYKLDTSYLDINTATYKKYLADWIYRGAVWKERGY